MTGGEKRNIIISMDTVNKMNSNMEKGILIYGAGGHALVIADLIASLNGQVHVFFDDEVKEGNGKVQHYNAQLFKDAGLIIGIGNNTVRQRIAYNVMHSFVSLIHPDASVSDSIITGEGTVILAMAVVQANVMLGKHVIINAGAVVDHDAVIEDFVHIAPNAYIGGGAHVGKGAVIGAGAVLSRFAKVKANTVVPPLTVV